MQTLNEEIACMVAEVWRDENRIPVFGEGAQNARVMLIGEAPGEQETMQKRPFVGKAGRNLDAFLEIAELSREQLYVTNAVKVRPTKRSKAGRIVNRPPTAQEIKAFLPYLRHEIARVAPEVVVTLGNTPLQALRGKEAAVGDMHGKLYEGEEYRLYPMYHPASLIYNPSLKEIYREDILRLARILRNL